MPVISSTAGARFGEPAEFLLLVNESLQRLMEQWRKRRADDRRRLASFWAKWEYVSARIDKLREGGR